MNSLDRFSRPLHSEGVGVSLEALQEQHELNKLSIVDDYLVSYFCQHDTLPDPEEVQENLFPLDIALNQIEERIRLY